MTTCGCYWCSEGMTDRSAMGILLEYIVYLEKELVHEHSLQRDYFFTPTEPRFDFVHNQGERMLTEALQYALDADGVHHYGLEWDEDKHRDRRYQVEVYNEEVNKRLNALMLASRERDDW